MVASDDAASFAAMEKKVLTNGTYQDLLQFNDSKNLWDYLLGRIKFIKDSDIGGNCYVIFWVQTPGKRAGMKPVHIENYFIPDPHREPNFIPDPDKEQIFIRPILASPLSLLEYFRLFYLHFLSTQYNDMLNICYCTTDSILSWFNPGFWNYSDAADIYKQCNKIIGNNFFIYYIESINSSPNNQVWGLNMDEIVNDDDDSYKTLVNKVKYNKKSESCSKILETFFFTPEKK